MTLFVANTKTPSMFLLEAYVAVYGWNFPLCRVGQLLMRHENPGRRRFRCSIPVAQQPSNLLSRWAVSNRTVGLPHYEHLADCTYRNVARNKSRLNASEDVLSINSRAFFSVQNPANRGFHHMIHISSRFIPIFAKGRSEIHRRTGSRCL